jgi:hypothetical protein
VDAPDVGPGAVRAADGETGRYPPDQARLAEEQATLVARATPPGELFATVAEEAGQLLGVDFAILVRYDPQDTL